MQKVNIGDNLSIQCYKHDKQINGHWEESVLIKETDEYIIVGNNKTKVVEKDGSSWNTKEKAIIYFFKNKWFNIIVQFKKDGIYYYCNIASPYIIEENTIKYIDYDLDLRIYKNGSYKILDKKEYNFNKKKFSYSKQLDYIVKNSLNELIKLYNENFFSFNNEQNIIYKEKYDKIIAKK